MEGGIEVCGCYVKSSIIPYFDEDILLLNIKKLNMERWLTIHYLSILPCQCGDAVPGLVTCGLTWGGLAVFFFGNLVFCNVT